MQNTKVSSWKTNLDRGPFTTIDDLTHLAEQLVAGLQKLSEYKHPLDIRRGVGKRKEVVEHMTEDKDSLQVKGSGRTYFLDVATTRTKEAKRYLKITESRMKDREGKPERNTLFVFPEDAEKFSKAVAKMVAKLS